MILLDLIYECVVHCAHIITNRYSVDNNMISHGLYLFNRYFVLLIHTTLDNEHGLFGCPTSCTLEKQRCDIFGSCRNKNKQQKEKETNETSFTIHFVDESRHILVLGCSIAALVEIIDSVEHG